MKAGRACSPGNSVLTFMKYSVRLVRRCSSFSHAAVSLIILRGITQKYPACNASKACLFEQHAERQKLHLLYDAISAVLLQRRFAAPFQLQKQANASQRLFFTSHLIAVIRKSSSSDSEWVCAGWLQRLDWMWNKQGLSQRAAKTIKWSLWGRPARLWWLCASHESAYPFRDGSPSLFPPNNLLFQSAALFCTFFSPFYWFLFLHPLVFFFFFVCVIHLFPVPMFLSVLDSFQPSCPEDWMYK